MALLETKVKPMTTISLLSYVNFDCLHENYGQQTDSDFVPSEAKSGPFGTFTSKPKLLRAREDRFGKEGLGT